MRKLGRYFLQGLLYTLPVAVTVYLFIFVFSWVDSLIQKTGLLNQFDAVRDGIPGVGIIVFILMITIIGFLGEHLITTPAARSFGKLLDKAPIFKIIYTSIKDLLSAFVGKERKFDTPVLVNIDSTSHLQRLGFITSNDLQHLGLEGKVAVYLPSSYGMLGELVIVDEKHVTIVEANSAEIMKFIVSGGVTRI